MTLILVKEGNKATCEQIKLDRDKFAISVSGQKG